MAKTNFLNKIFFQKLSIKKEDFSKHLYLNQYVSQKQVTEYDKINNLCYNLYRLCESKKSANDVISRAKELGIVQNTSQAIAGLKILMANNLIEEDTKNARYLSALQKGQDIAEDIMPEDVDWILTYRCNLDCNMCYLNSDCARKDLGLNTKNQLGKKEELSFEKVKLLMDDLAINKKPSISFSGGEPFLREDFFDILKYATNKKMVGEVATNATLISETMAEFLMENDWKITASLDGSNASINDTIRRRKGVFDIAVKNIKQLVELRDYFKSGKISIRCTLQNKNIGDIENMLKLSRLLRVDELEFNLLTYMADRGFVDEIFYKKLKSQIQNFFRQGVTQPFKWGKFILNGKISCQDIVNCEIAKSIIPGEKLPCFVCGNILHIDPFGNVRPCCVGLKDKHIMGNLTQHSLNQVWFGKRFNTFRKGLANIDLQNELYSFCSYCDQFPENARLNNLLKNINKK